MTVSQEIKVGIVGLGPHFKEILLPALLAQDNVILSAFCDNVEGARQWASSRFPHTTIASDFMDDNFWNQIDCVACASWPKVHQTILKEAVSRKKHCFCEKPAALDTSALDEIIDFIVAVAGNVSEVKDAVWSRKAGSETLTAIFKNVRCPLTCLFATNAAMAFTCKATAILEGGGVITLDTLRNVVMTGIDPTAKRKGEVWRERDLGTIVMNDGYIDELKDFFSEIRGVGHCHLPDIVQARHVLSIIGEILNR